MAAKAIIPLRSGLKNRGIPPLVSFYIYIYSNVGRDMIYWVR